MISVYGETTSGNCWKATQLLRLVGQPFTWIEIDSTGGQTRTPSFLAINPRGKVPCLRLEDGGVLTESNAILAHFAEGTQWLPTAGMARTRVMEWLFWEQYSHEPCIAVARSLLTYKCSAALQPERMAQCREQGERALAIMQDRLAAHDWLTDAGPSIADIALFAYTHVADEGGFDLAMYPGVAAWVARFAALPGVVGLR